MNDISRRDFLKESLLLSIAAPLACLPDLAFVKDLTPDQESMVQQVRRLGWNVETCVFAFGEQVVLVDELNLSYGPVYEEIYGENFLNPIGRFLTDVKFEMLIKSTPSILVVDKVDDFMLLVKSVDKQELVFSGRVHVETPGNPISFRGILPVSVTMLNEEKHG